MNHALPSLTAWSAMVARDEINAYSECCEHCHAEKGWKHYRDCPLAVRHIHISESSSDCDGPHEHDHIAPGLLEEYISWCHIPYTHSGDGTFSYTVEHRGEKTFACLSFSGPTDEGYHSIEYVECDDDCDPNESSQRDVFAEQMGY